MRVGHRTAAHTSFGCNWVDEAKCYVLGEAEVLSRKSAPVTSIATDNVAVTEPTQSGSQRKKSRGKRTEQLRSSLNNSTDDDNIDTAPISDSNEAEESQDESLGEDISEWLIFRHEVMPESNAEVMEITGVSMYSNDVLPFDGLHWESVTQINELHSNKMEHTPTK